VSEPETKPIAETEAAAVAGPVGRAGAGAPVLVADLDDTVLRTNLLPESFFAALGERPAAALVALASLLGGRARLKARLAEIGAPDPALLPYREEVLERLRAARAEGRRTALVSAADGRLVRAVADHLGLFDEAHGSDERTNLKGPGKAAFLAGRYGEGGFDYMGDAEADLAVWARARGAITVDAGPELRRAAERVRPEAEHLAPRAGGAARLLPYLRAVRPHQWLKNALLLLPPLAAHSTDPAVWGAVLLAALAFSMTASSAYLLNDLLDLAHDRAHPRKRARPFASGEASLAAGAFLSAGLGLGAALLALIALPLAFLGVLLLYAALTLAYSFVLKRQLVVDIVTLAGLYTLRVIAGGVATGIALSPWLLAFSGFLFFALAAMKRQAELVDGARRGSEQAAGRAWRVEDMPVVAMMAIASGYAAVLVLALYISSEDVQGLYSEPDLLWLACPVLLFWISRLVLVTHRGGMTDDPMVYALKDRASLAAGGLVAGLAVAGSLL
jgi:4-hydroxybenzoate polyprenyltransferase/phosphoserine phosphatase